MVNVTVTDGTVVFEPAGWSRVWTLRRRIVVPRDAIRLVRRAPADLVDGWWHGWRLPGTQIPGVIVAGSYYQDGEWTFWDVRGRGRQAIEVQLAGQRYRRLVIDVANPADAVRRIQAARR